MSIDNCLSLDFSPVSGVCQTLNKGGVIGKVKVRRCTYHTALNYLVELFLTKEGRPSVTNLNLSVLKSGIKIGLG